MDKSILLGAFFILSCLGSSPAWAGRTKVPQYIYALNLKVFDAETGKRRTLPTHKSEIIRESSTISNVTFFHSDNKALRLEVMKQDDFEDTVYLTFKTVESAAIMKDILTKGENSLIMVYDVSSKSVKDQISYVDVYANGLYVWDEQTETLSKVGNLIGPRRSAQEENFLDKIIRSIFGAPDMTDVNYLEQSIKQDRPTTDI